MSSPHSNSTEREARGLAILGATGSIGRSTCDVVRRRPHAFRIRALSAHKDLVGFLPLVEEFRPEAVCLTDPEANARCRGFLEGSPTIVLDSASGLVECARWPGVDRVVNAVVGAAGLAPSVAALDAGRELALANKESLVLAGGLLTERARRTGKPILPIDSEHGSLLLCLRGVPAGGVRGVTLTASGGPFRTRSRADMEHVTPEEALRHPTWRMGARITIDSATLMNKGFEVIEAHWLFGLAPEAIRVVVHPQSIVHALVTLSDGSQLAHLSRPDMRLPIDVALSWPDPPPERWPPSSLAEVGPLTFEEPDRERFPCLALAEEALRAGGTMPAVLNAADEVVVEAFLAGRVRFGAIPMVISDVLARHAASPADTLERVLDADAWARAVAKERVSSLH